MEGLWVALLGLLTAGYFALAGFDYGVGLLFRFVGRDEAERTGVIRTMTPFFLGNEVWLVAAVGVLFGAFPRLEGELLSAHHGSFVTILVGLVMFTAAVQLRSHPLWDVPLVAGALIVAAGWGVLLGNVLGGPPFLWAAGLVTMFLLHGAVFLTWRLHGPLRSRAVLLARVLIAPSAAFVVAAVLLSGPVQAPTYGWAGATLVLFLLGGTWPALRRRLYLLAFLCTATTCAVPALAVFGAQAVVTTETMSHAPTLEALTWPALAVLPLVLVFQWTTWWMSRATR
ncbi:cytochrome d ubiquinol oxidase subunit II [Saccharothrix tamanrassetensis]|uniref:Cytochrome d ubiquinol oxidase subunit II n=1 Tax=Saccharothrix tamanrassetensis TaxID=1051531 RepID=A0A841CFT8_9PSEU|nr:cytochrome d ubiquinol oxidase subunit II [Saccharothrix tamanrassetensis]MBB5956191.1 cytochrome d ubiquinol oxidase subunit II [Saccharothrix tamanrassetensis]